MATVMTLGNSHDTWPSAAQSVVYCHGRPILYAHVFLSLDYTLLLVCPVLPTLSFLHCFAINHILQPLWSPTENLLLERCGDMGCFLTKVFQLEFDCIPLLRYTILHGTVSELRRDRVLPASCRFRVQVKGVGGARACVCGGGGRASPAAV